MPPPDPPSSSPPKGVFAFVSLGCPKNLVDSERMLGALRRAGYRLASDPDGADFVIVNTCGFVEPARVESYSVIDEMLELKRQRKTRGVIVAGCLAERQKEAILEERPEIDSVVGVFAREEIAQVADRLVGRLHEQRAVFRPAPLRPLPDRDRFRITPRHFAYLKIAEGCDRTCTFCAIPQLRGRHASKPLEEIVEEAEQLAADGARELIVVAQDTTYYGIDLCGRPQLAALLQSLEQIDGLQWIRLMYLYPTHLTEELMETIAGSRRILPYIDLPLQHINDEVLRRMGRRITRREIETLLASLRRRIPELAVRTTFLAGFPGETERQFEELLDFAAQQRFERLGAFAYSREPGTPAAGMPGHLPEDVKTHRRDRLMAIQQEIAFQWNQDLVGRRLDVIVDRPASEDHNQVWIGRTPYDAPDIDGLAYVTSGPDRLSAGAIIRCEIAASEGYDLAAAPVDKPR